MTSIKAQRSTTSSQLAVSTQYTRQEVLDAIRAVTVYTIADVFNLKPEEVFWTSHHIDKALQIYADSPLYSMQVPVSYELASNEYSKKIKIFITGGVQPKATLAGKKRIDLIDWATVISNIATESFNDRPLKHSSYMGNVMGVLSELGVGDTKNPRNSNYYPNTIMYLKNSR